jgi:F-type H+-transporting ATPase subunit b
MRILSRGLFLLVASAPALGAQEGEPVNLLSPSGGLMFWTLLIFVVLFFILSRFAFKPITAAVDARERALEEAIESARRDREAAAEVLAEQKRHLDAARMEAQQFIADGRATAEKLRQDLLSETRAQQQEMLERARHEIDAEKVKAVAELRREAVDLAIAAAGKVVSKNLDQATNREIVERFLASIEPGSVRG